MPILLFKSHQCEDIVCGRNWRATLKGAETLGENSLYIPFICISLLFLHISHIPKSFLTLDIFLIIYLLCEIICSLLNLFQLYPAGERCRRGADEGYIAPRPGPFCTSISWGKSELAHQTWHPLIPFSLSVISLSETITQIWHSLLLKKARLPQLLDWKGPLGHLVQSPGLDPSFSML